MYCCPLLNTVHTTIGWFGNILVHMIDTDENCYEIPIASNTWNSTVRALSHQRHSWILWHLDRVHRDRPGGTDIPQTIPQTLPLFRSGVFSTIQIWVECQLTPLAQCNHHLRMSKKNSGWKQIKRVWTTTTATATAPTCRARLTIP